MRHRAVRTPPPRLAQGRRRAFASALAPVLAVTAVLVSGPPSVRVVIESVTVEEA